nr:uncharacterized protein LOC102132243 [Macaca fascicularis]
MVDDFTNVTSSAFCVIEIPFSTGQSLLAEEKYHGSLMCNWDLTSHKTQESPRRAFSMCFNLVHHSPSMFPPEKQETAQVGRKGHLSNKKMALAALVDLCFSVWALPVSGRCFLSARSYRYKSTQESRQAVNCRCHLTNSHSIPGKQDMNGKLFHSSVSGNVYELLTGECEFPQGEKKLHCKDSAWFHVPPARTVVESLRLMEMLSQRIFVIFT